MSTGGIAWANWLTRRLLELRVWECVALSMGQDPTNIRRISRAQALVVERWIPASDHSPYVLLTEDALVLESGIDVDEFRRRIFLTERTFAVTADSVVRTDHFADLAIEFQWATPREFAGLASVATASEILDPEASALKYKAAESNSAKAVQRSHAHREQILRVIANYGWEPLDLPFDRGRTGTKAKIRSQLQLTSAQFDHAWKALRTDGDIDDPQPPK